MKTEKTRRTIFPALLALAVPAFAGGFQLETNVVVSFADADAGRKILTARDDFVQALSPFDRAARLKTDRDVSEKEYLDFVGRNVLAWEPEETNRITAQLRRAGSKLARWHLPFPAVIVLVKTTGQEEGHASYTRQNAVILPQNELKSANLEGTLIHELFHVLSRHNPELRKRLYAVLGFKPTGAIELPPELERRKITNPDGVDPGWFITVTNRGRAQPAVPILYASADRYDPATGGEFFNYLVFKLLAVTNDGGHWKPDSRDGQPQLLEPGKTDGYLEQVGRNTQYIIHPDEILADNFVSLVNGRTNLATPRIVTEMERVFRQP